MNENYTNEKKRTTKKNQKKNEREVTNPAYANEKGRTNETWHTRSNKEKKRTRINNIETTTV